MRGQKAWDLVFREMQNETEVELSIIPDSFLPTEDVWPRGTWDLSSPTSDQACSPCTGWQSPHHWKAGKAP